MSSQRVNVKAEPTCRVCSVVLQDDNWYASSQKIASYICKGCVSSRRKQWYSTHTAQDKARVAQHQKKHPELARAKVRRYWAKKEAENIMKYGHGNPERVYYTYCLYTYLPSGKKHVFYVGKGKGDRMYAHEKLYRNKLKRAKPDLDPKEKFMLFCEDNGWQLYTGIFAQGMSEDESYNHERELILYYKLEKLTNVMPPHRPRIVKAPTR